MDNTDDILEETGTVLPDPKTILPETLNEKHVLFMGPVQNGYFMPVADKLNSPPRWEQGTYSLTAGKWPSPNLTADLMDLSPYNGNSIMVIATTWNKEVISQAKIFGVLNNVACDVIQKFVFEKLQEKEEEIAVYISGIGN
ncbi:hypothetical protein [Pontibacter vulgaris]|uniref:hypothetical protein n=1 Tax=Pontibacter vulgaris TaxID=2905679 RepID=UPI001FA7F551|nr:hypothetical protein [Pontibacter vulgaris]